MQVINQTRNTVVAERCRVARSWWARGVGLYLTRRFETGDGLLFPGTRVITMLGMRFAIDVVALDRDLRVTRTATLGVLCPAWWGGRGTDAVLELPRGTVARTGTQRGDVLRMTDRVPGD